MKLLVDNKTFILNSRLYGASYTVDNIDWDAHDSNPCRGSCLITKFIELKEKKTVGAKPVATTSSEEPDTDAAKKARERENDKAFPSINVTLFESFTAETDVTVKAEFVMWGNHVRELGFSSPFASDRILHSNHFDVELVDGFDKDKTGSKAAEVETTETSTTYPLVLKVRRLKTLLQPDRYPKIDPVFMKKVIVAITGKNKAQFDTITDEAVKKAVDIVFMSVDPKTKIKLPLTMPMNFVQPLPFNESAELVNVNRLSHEGLKMLFGGGLSKMEGEDMDAQEKPYLIDAEDYPYTFHALVGHSDIELVRQVYSSPDELAKFITAYCYVTLEQDKSEAANQNPYTKLISKGTTHIEFFAVRKNFEQ